MFKNPTLRTAVRLIAALVLLVGGNLSSPVDAEDGATAPPARRISDPGLVVRLPGVTSDEARAHLKDTLAAEGLSWETGVIELVADDPRFSEELFMAMSAEAAARTVDAGQCKDTGSYLDLIIRAQNHVRDALKDRRQARARFSQARYWLGRVEEKLSCPGEVIGEAEYLRMRFLSAVLEVLPDYVSAGLPGGRGRDYYVSRLSDAFEARLSDDPHLTFPSEQLFPKDEEAWIREAFAQAWRSHHPMASSRIALPAWTHPELWIDGAPIPRGGGTLREGRHAYQWVVVESGGSRRALFGSPDTQERGKLGSSLLRFLRPPMFDVARLTGEIAEEVAGRKPSPELVAILSRQGREFGHRWICLVGQGKGVVSVKVVPAGDGRDARITWPEPAKAATGDTAGAPATAATPAPTLADTASMSTPASSEPTLAGATGAREGGAGPVAGSGKSDSSSRRGEQAQAPGSALSDPARALPEPVYGPAAYEPSPPKPGQVVWTVKKDGSGNFRTIGDALRQARDGERIEVYPGHYDESFTIERSIELVGVGKLEEIVIEGKPSARCTSFVGVIRSIAKQGRIANVTVSSSARSVDDSTIHVDAGALVVEGCAIAGGGYTVMVEDDSEATLIANQVRGGWYSGVAYWNASHGRLERNEIGSGNFVGVEIYHDASVGLRANKIHDNRGAAIRISGKATGTFEDNDLRGNKGGAWDLRDGAESRIKRYGNLE